jgi:hypothetical protein
LREALRGYIETCAEPRQSAGHQAPRLGPGRTGQWLSSRGPSDQKWSIP